MLELVGKKTNAFIYIHKYVCVYVYIYIYVLLQISQIIISGDAQYL